MSSTHATQSSTSALGTRLWGRAATLVRNFLQRLVVPVSSTDEMNEVWKLYRLTSTPDPVQSAAARKLAASSRP